jgi:hypothetical protein
MTAYKQNLLSWACFMILIFSTGSAVLYISKWFILPFFIIVFTAHIFFDKITCPSCGAPVTYEGGSKREGPFARFGIPSAFFRKKCANCGWDLNKNLQKSE